MRKVLIVNEKETKKTTGRNAVFVHLYYEDTVDFFFHYITKIPKNIDIYITTSNPRTKERIIEKKRIVHQEFVLVDGINRGRDVAALLVTLNKYVYQYDFFCFVHDKKAKETAQNEYTQQFIECIWDNMLHSEEYINGLLELFESNSRLGLLLPPLYIGEYAKCWLGVDWGNNYKNTKKIANMIGLKEEVINETKLPSSFGTTFWARTNAIKKLFDFVWKYDDFPIEPLEDDGQINHAIERILEFVVEDAGYDAVNVMSQQYAEIHIEFLQMISRELGKRINELYGVRDLHQFRKVDKTIEMISKFSHECEELYVFGAGVYGRSCINLLKHQNVDIKGIIVSKVQDKSTLDGYMIHNIKEVPVSKATGVIIALLNKKSAEDVKEMLENIGIRKIFFYVQDNIE